MRIRMLMVLAVVALVAFVGMAFGADHEYIGAKKCRMCHKVEFTSWEKTSHATAFDTLKPEEQGNAECVDCHTTVANAELPGVQCEACHGPGADYKGKKVMEDRAASVAAGLQIPDEKTCVKCHNDKSPHFKGFNFEERKGQVHEKKQK